MNKKTTSLIAIIIIAIFTISILNLKHNQTQQTTKQEIQQQFQSINTQYELAKTNGFDVSETDKIIKDAKKAFNAGDYKKANKLIKKTIDSLNDSKMIKPSNPPVQTPTDNSSSITTTLSQIKTAIVYERLGDARPKRTTDEQIQILKDTKANMIFRANWRWNPTPNNCLEIDQNKIQLCKNSGYSFEQLKDIIQEIKKEIPNIIIAGAIPAQRIVKNEEVNEKTGETFNETETWAMAIDPAKWGIKSITKEEFQNSVGSYSYSGPDGYYPDITNSKFQEILLSWAKNQIDMGFDAIWIDLLYTQSNLLLKITDFNFEHPAVKESFEASSQIIDEIHNYAKSKDKIVYVGTWDTAMNYPYTAPKLDFVTIAPSAEEILTGNFDENKWVNRKQKIKDTFGDVLIIAFIDWSGDNGQIARFSQELSREEQNKAINDADEFFSSMNITFTYPLHGGNIGESATTLSYGKYGWYDALAPEFDTYKTIVELANKKTDN